jgi:hypothetical protein
MFEKPEGSIKNGQSRHTGNIRHTRHRTKANKTQHTSTQKSGKHIIIEHHNQHAPKVIIICYRDVSKQVDFHYPSDIFKPFS